MEGDTLDAAEEITELAEDVCESLVEVVLDTIMEE